MAAPDPDEAERFARRVAAVYADAHNRILETMAAKLRGGGTLDPSAWIAQKHADLAPIVQASAVLVDDANGAARRALEEGLEATWTKAATEAVDDLAELGIGEALRIGTDTQAVDAITRETVGRLQDLPILRTVEDEWRNVIADTASRATTGTVTVQEAAADAVQQLADRGLRAFTDRAGRQWSLESYAEMSVRTAHGRAQIQGHLDEYQAHNRDLVIVSDHTQECALCRPWEGKVLSISGESGEYPSLSRARSAGLQHPGCRHDIRVYIPGLTKPVTGTEDPEGDQARQRQREMERNIRRWKRRAAVAEPGSPQAVTAQAKVREWQQSLRGLVADKGLKRQRARERV